MPVVTSRDQVDAIHQQVVEMVERFGFEDWKLDYEFPTPDGTKKIQIRSEEHVAPRAEVAKIKAAKKRGEKFPAIVMTSDGFIVDGNTRDAADLSNGNPYTVALILDQKYEGATESQLRALTALGAAFNARHGKGIDKQEIRRAVMRIAEDPNYTATRIAALIGVSETVVTALINEKKARDRAERLGLHVNGSLSGTKLKLLGRQAETLNDEPFLQLFRLAEDTGMTQGELGDVIKRAKEEKSDAGALKVLQEEREVRKDQIQQYKLTNKAIPTAATLVRQRLGFILNNYSGNPHDIVEYTPGKSQEYKDMLEKVIILLERALAEQDMVGKEG